MCFASIRSCPRLAYRCHLSVLCTDRMPWRYSGKQTRPAETLRIVGSNIATGALA
ncbi:hypothetical protein PoB_004923800 [Plakobranchus ocellatus]|uniref:Uncharacterized protein n=1 Tax=Plakobranchus ocellatus TaxID=259542 RepID=A0AAV4BT01_9GAST|nr:hypothetical protein PoB_004923800 [Plakobranchus ocellatus]